MTDSTEVPTVLSPRDSARISRAIGMMYYAGGLTQLQPFTASARPTMDDLISLLEEFQEVLREVAESNQESDEKLMALKDTIRGGRKLFQLLTEAEVSS